MTPPSAPALGGEFYALLQTVTDEHTPNAYTALRLLPDLIVAQQDILKDEQARRKARAGK